MENELHCPGCYACGEEFIICQECFQVCSDCASVCDTCEMCFDCAMSIGAHCPTCYACGEEETICEECHEACSECSGICDNCEMCISCATNNGRHCPTCGACGEEETICTECGDVCSACEEACANCGMCLNCALDNDLHCQFCGACGEEETICSECREACTACDDMCESCGMCFNCAIDNELHCRNCSACSDEVTICPECGDVCSDCADDWCLNCEMCYECGIDQGLHCSECGECFEEVEQCENSENHCVDCCNCDEETYSVFFRPGFSLTVGTQHVIPGEKAARPADPKAQGYIFGGWYTDPECTSEFYFDTPITGDITLYAKWTKIERYAMNVVVSDDEGNASVGGKVSLKTHFDSKEHGGSLSSTGYGNWAERNTTVEIKAQPDSGYSFVGWREVTFDGKPFTTEAEYTFTATGRRKLCAVFRKDDSSDLYKVTYHTGFGNDLSENVEPGKKATRPTDPEAQGYVFESWYEDPGFAKEYDFDTPVSSSITLYAKWTKIETWGMYVSVSDDEGNASVGGKVSLKTHLGSEVLGGGWSSSGYGYPAESNTTVEIKAQPAPGYTFVGWKVKTFDGELFSNEAECAFPAVTRYNLCAVFKAEDSPDTHKVTFDTTGSGLKINPQIVENGKKAVKPDVPQNSSHIFGGWYTDPELTKTFDFDTAIYNDLTLYARWFVRPEADAISVRVSDDEGNARVGGKASLRTQVGSEVRGGSLSSAGYGYWAEVGTTAEIKAKAVAGYSFVGWRENTFDGELFTTDAECNFTVTEGLSLYAVFSKDDPSEQETYTLTTSVSGGHGTISESKTNLAKDTVEKVTFTPDTGYVIDTITVNGAKVGLISGEMNITMIEDTTVVVTYKEEEQPPVPTTHTVTFNANGGYCAVPSAATTDGKLTFLPTPTRSGHYSFNGWYTAANGGTKVTVDTVYTEDTTIYAHWTYIGGSGHYTPAPAPKLPFKDVSESDTFYDDVYYAYFNDLMVGVSDTLFAPYITLSRGMIVTILYRIEGEPAFMNDNIFSDVETGSWYEKAVVWANSKGIVLGYGNGKFGPSDPVTREQLAAILYRYEQYRGGGFKGSWMFPLNYADAQDVSSYANEAMHWTVMNGLMDDSNGRLYPRDNATRAVVATFLHRFCVKFGK